LKFKLLVRKLKGKTQLGIDLHWMHKDSSYGGFLAVGGRRDVEQTGPQTFRVTFNLQEGMAAVVPTVFPLARRKLGSSHP
jgi:hypothetical protein